MSQAHRHLEALPRLACPQTRPLALPSPSRMFACHLSLRPWSLHPLAAAKSASIRIVSAWIDEALVGGLEIRSCGLGGQQVRCSCSGVLALCVDRFLVYLGLQRFGS